MGKPLPFEARSARSPYATAEAGIAILILLALTALALGPVVRNPFVSYDDPDYVVLNPLVHGGLTLAGIRAAASAVCVGNWHPLTTQGPQHTTGSSVRSPNDDGRTARWDVITRVSMDESFLVDRAAGRRREEERFVGRAERGGHGAEHRDDSGTAPRFDGIPEQAPAGYCPNRSYALGGYVNFGAQ